MWDDVLTNVRHFPTAVLTGLDADGYPASVRCRPYAEGDQQVLRVQVPDDTLRPGPAGLLCHRHDDLLTSQRSFLVRGVLAQDGQDWLFRPTEFIDGVDAGNPLALVNFVRASRRAAAAYLAKRGLPRPTIPWDEINAVKAQVKKK